MNANYSLWSRIGVSIQKNPIKLLSSIFLVYAVLWTLLEPILGLVDLTELYVTGWTKFTFFVLISVAIGIYRAASPRDVLLKYNNSLIRITFGDLFSFDGFKVIPASRRLYETEIVETSLQNVMIRKFIQSNEGIQGLDEYKRKLSDALKDKTFEVNTGNKQLQQEKIYPLGATAQIQLNGELFLLFALTKTESKGHIPPDNCNVSDMWRALNEFWQEARIHARGKAVNIPLIGSGITGINLPPNHILLLNLLAIFNSLVEGGRITTDEIRIILHYKYMEDIDLKALEAVWI